MTLLFEPSELGAAARTMFPIGSAGVPIKAVSDMYSPVDGEIIEVNAEVADRLDTLSDDPYQAGWFVKIRIADGFDLSQLMDYAAYQKQCQEEMTNDE